MQDQSNVAYPKYAKKQRGYINKTPTNLQCYNLYMYALVLLQVLKLQAIAQCQVLQQLHIHSKTRSQQRHQTARLLLFHCGKKINL